MTLENMRAKLAVSLALPDTEACLTALWELRNSIEIAEIRLDLMDSFDLALLIGKAPCPLVITCRPEQEGGRFTGSEKERLDLLAYAASLGCAYVDIEWDSLTSFNRLGKKANGIIVSRHWIDHMPGSLLPAYAELCQRADVVKLVGYARRPADTMTVFRLMKDATSPVIAIAMGEAGWPTRLLSACFDKCFLTYGAFQAGMATAPGQLSVKDMVELYHLPEVGSHTKVDLHFCSDIEMAGGIAEKNRDVTGGDRLFLGWVVPSDDVKKLTAVLTSCLPNLSVTVASELCQREI
jgi:3-dehydroquinate dehydratase/shikimate dehydrogenase